MKKSRNIVLIAVLMITSLCAFREWQIHGSATARLGIGPDVIVGHIPSVRRWGSEDGFTSFSIGTTSCNIGDTRLDWISNSTIHPVISQNLYRVMNGRIEQIGMSWLKHGFAVAAGDHCDTCTDPAGNYLGVGCSDPYGASLNGSQGRLGPRSEVNAHTGVFAWPHADLPATGVLDGRIRVDTDDLDPAQNPGARYFVESQYVHPQDASSGNGLNNGSYREAFTASLGGGAFDLDTGSPGTVREESAINAWQAVNPDVDLYVVDIPGDGRVIVGVLIEETKAGFHTEIAIENLTSDQSVRSLGAKFGSNAITNPGFNDVDYQFETYSGTDWTPVVTGNEISWSTQTFSQNASANALRWNSMYSYWCDSDTCPSQLTLGLFKPGSVNEVTVDIAQPVTPEANKLRDGVQTGGTLADVNVSDDQYLELDPSPTKNPVKQKIDMILLSTSNTFAPTGMSIRLEAAMIGGASGDVIQSVEMFNYLTNDFEIVDVRPAVTVDESLEVSPTGDFSRFVNSKNGEIVARIIWRSASFAGSTFFWNVDVDEAVWLIMD